jgi:hypothetical protein
MLNPDIFIVSVVYYNSDNLKMIPRVFLWEFFNVLYLLEILLMEI